MSTVSDDLEAREVHDWVTKHGYLNAPMSERARRLIERLQIRLTNQSEELEQWRKLDVRSIPWFVDQQRQL